MRKSFVTFAIFAALLTPAVSIAGHYSDFYVIPAVAHTPGANGTNWMSDIAIYNFQTAPLTVELIFVQSGEGNPNNVNLLSPPELNPSGSQVTIPGGGSVLLKDVVNNVVVPNQVLGAILIQGSHAFAVTSRTYSQSPSGDTVGQTVLPARDFLENAVGDVLNPGATAYIPGLISNSRFRTNLGFVAATAENSGGMTIEVTLRGADGTVLGTPRSFFLGSGTFGSFLHLQFSTQSITTTPFDIGGATFRITDGDGAVSPYASVVDNVTADAVFIAGQFPPSTAFPKVGRASAFRRSFASAKSR